MDCFYNTTWFTFIDNATNIHDLTVTVCDYITFCVDICVPDKIITIFPNNKPWISKSIKSLLNLKRIAFASGDPCERKSVQQQLQKEIRRGQRVYKQKLENQFAHRHIR